MSITGFNRPDFGMVVHDQEALCILCGRESNQRSILATNVVNVEENYNSNLPHYIGVCEPCSHLAAWRWRQTTDEVAAGPYPTQPQVVNLLIVRPRKITTMVRTGLVHPGDPDDAGRQDVEISDPAIPFDVLMVERKEVPGNFGLPGGKVEQGEDPIAAAVRELAEETGLTTWAPALEVLAESFTCRGRLARVYLCRAYAGDPATREAGVNVEWKPGAPSQHSGPYRGFYAGVEVAWEMKRKLYEALETTVPLCTRMGRAAGSYVELMHKGFLTPDEHQLLTGFKFAMSEDEKHAASLVCREVERAKKAEEAKKAEQPVHVDAEVEDLGLDEDLDEGAPP